MKTAIDYFQLVMSDDAHSHLNGYINKQTCRVWATENPKVTQKRVLHTLRVPVWYGISANGITGSYFFEDDNRNTANVNGERYQEITENFRSPATEERYLQDARFQQDGATCHTVRLTVQIWKGLFPNNVISRNEEKNWPPRSPDLSAADLFLLGFLKNRMGENKP
jgi:hypothetical protein